MLLEEQHRQTHFCVWFGIRNPQLGMERLRAEYEFYCKMTTLGDVTCQEFPE